MGGLRSVRPLAGRARLEQRFTKDEIAGMMEAAGLGDISLSKGPPHWVACGYRKS